MKLNNIFCGGYSTYKNEVEFSLIDTNYNDVSELNGKTLTLSIFIDNNVWGASVGTA